MGIELDHSRVWWYGPRALDQLTVRYWATRKLREDLERRLSETDGGYDWVQRAKRIGFKPRPRHDV